MAQKATNIGIIFELGSWFAGGRNQIAQGLASLEATHPTTFKWQAWVAAPTIFWVTDPRYPNLVWFRWPKQDGAYEYTALLTGHELDGPPFLLRSDQ